MRDKKDPRTGHSLGTTPAFSWNDTSYEYSGGLKLDIVFPQLGTPGRVWGAWLPPVF